jgi:CHAD domain-containing protein
MHEQLLELTGDVSREAARLRVEYDPTALHAFRVAIRRIRSILKQMGGYRARRYRKIWGGFAVITNQARDWDVFMNSAADLLDPKDFATFRQLNDGHLATSHGAVREVVQSAHWQRHLVEWTGLMKRSIDRAPEPTAGPESLDEVLAKASLVLGLALAQDDDRAWHKFRIAVKDVRYVVDAAPPEALPEAERAAVIEACKELQTLLGEWHDTVVQLNQLEELDPVPVHAALAKHIAERQRDLLVSLRHLLAGSELFRAAAGPDPAGEP